MVSFDPNEPIPLHLAQLIGQGTAIYIQIVGQLLTVKGNEELPLRMD